MSRTRALVLSLTVLVSSLALMAAGWGLIETAILVFVTLNDFDTLRILSGADYLKAFESSQLHALARLSISAHDATYNVGLVFAGIRSYTFCYLWFRSGFIPRLLAVWGMIASLLMGACAFSFIIFPELRKVIPLEIYGGLIFVFELAIGFWLLYKSLRLSGMAEPDKAVG